MKSKVLILAALLASSAMGATVTLTMNEVANQVIDGLVVNKGGIGFTFSNPGGSIRYNVVTGLGSETYVSDPVVYGNNSAFGVAFSVPVSTVQFGLAANSSSAVASMATVALYNNSAVPFATFSLGSGPVDPFAENQFTYNGPTQVTNILVTPTSNGFSAVMFDNLTVTQAPAPPADSVPAATPLTLAITAICLAGLTLLLLRKQPA